MNLSKIYTVCFERCAAGTFLIWFVSQHDNFSKLHHTYQNHYITDLKNTTIKLPNNTHHLDLHVNSLKYSIQSLDQYLARYFVRADPDNKIIFKIVPHDYPLVNKHIDHLPNINIIMLIVENYDWLNVRLESFGIGTRIVTEFRQNRIYQEQQNLQQYFENKGINYCKILIDKILKLDTAEYQKLLEFIDAPPIANWQDIIKEYKDKVGIII
jgi:hypothetical protein